MNLSKRIFICLATLAALFPFESRSKHVMVQKLTQICPKSMLAVTNDYDQTQVAIMNLHKFVFELTTNIQPSGVGKFGYVFIFKAFDDLEKTSVHLEAKKLVYLKEDSRYDEGLKDQEQFMMEVNSMQELNLMDPYNLYFPQYYSCMQVGEEFQQGLQDYSQSGGSWISGNGIICGDRKIDT